MHRLEFSQFDFVFQPGLIIKKFCGKFRKAYDNLEKNGNFWEMLENSVIGPGFNKTRISRVFDLLRSNNLSIVTASLSAHQDLKLNRVAANLLY